MNGGSTNNELNIKNIIDEDKKKEQSRKYEMPKAIISPKNNPKSKINIYDFIPTIKNENILQPTTNNNNNNIQQRPVNLPVNTLTKPQLKQIQQQQQQQILRQPAPVQKEQQFKTVSINPNLSENESQYYKGEPNASKSTQSNMNTHTPTPIKNIMQEKQLRMTNNLRDPGNVNDINNNRNSLRNNSGGSSNGNSIRNITIQKQSSKLSPKNMNTYMNMQNSELVEQVLMPLKSNNNSNNNSKKENGILETSELSNLEKQRIALQKQQMVELQKFKAKKAEIIKLNNRKKEIELMRSIEDEKNKLRKIQEKQHELNNIYNQQLHNHSSSNNNLTTKNIIYNVDAKKTKKNITNSIVSKPQSQPTITNVIDVPTAIISNANTKIQGKVKVIEKEKELNEKEVDTGDLSKKEVKEVKKETKKEVKKDAPLEYYSKKDKPDVKWPSKNELYDTKTFSESFTTVLGAPNFFNKKEQKDKTSIEDIHKTMQNLYGFKHINKFKDTLLTTIYKILSYEKIKWIPE